ncbi:Zinc finger, CCHC-type [Sesbania bispinosa]|nr:Zinc finger, CCHC-type [Sesbania bispinosa]
MNNSSGSLLPSTVQTQEEITVELDSEDLQSLQLAKRSLVGKILTAKTLNKGAVKSILLKAWRAPNDIQITDMGTNKSLFTFSTKDEAKEVMVKGPWYVMGSIISLQYWVPRIAAHEILFDRIPFWIQLHGLPLEMISTSNAAKIMNKIGEVQEVENPLVGNHLMRTFIRVKTLIDTKKPLSTGCWVPRKGMPKAWIHFRYERLQNLCYKCGILGHEQKECKQERIMESFNPSLPKFGPNLGVPPAKTMTTLMKEKGLWKKSSNQKEGAMETSSSQEREKTNSPEPNEEDDSTDKGTEENQQKQQDPVGPSRHNPTSTTTPADTPLQSGTEGTKKHLKETSGTQNIHSGTSKRPLSIFPTNMPSGPSLNSGPCPTLIDLIQGQLRAGLGPENINQLQIHKEFIGLKEPVTILDYPSPPRDPNLEFPLSEEAIAKCKTRCQNKEGNLGYYVQFPDEDQSDKEEEIGGKPTGHTLIPNEEEKQLICGWNRALSLKRKRTQEDLPENNNATGFQMQKKVRKTSQCYHMLEPAHYAAIHTEQLQLNLLANKKAEEAGQTMPPPQP